MVPGSSWNKSLHWKIMYEWENKGNPWVQTEPLRRHVLIWIGVLNRCNSYGVSGVTELVHLAPAGPQKLLQGEQLDVNLKPLFKCISKQGTECKAMKRLAKTGLILSWMLNSIPQHEELCQSLFEAWGPRQAHRTFGKISCFLYCAYVIPAV